MKFLKIVLLGLSLLVGFDSLAANSRYVFSFSHNKREIELSVLKLVKEGKRRLAVYSLPKAINQFKSRMETSQRYCCFSKKFGNEFYANESQAEFDRYLDLVRFCEKLLLKLDNFNSTRNTRSKNLNEKIKRLRGLPY